MLKTRCGCRHTRTTARWKEGKGGEQSFRPNAKGPGLGGLRTEHHGYMLVDDNPSNSYAAHISSISLPSS